MKAVYFFKAMVWGSVLVFPALAMAMEKATYYPKTDTRSAEVYLPDVKVIGSSNSYKAVLEREGDTEVFILKKVEKNPPEKSIDERVTIKTGVYGEGLVLNDAPPVETALEGEVVILFDNNDAIVGLGSLDGRGFYQILAQPGNYRLCLVGTGWRKGEDDKYHFCSDIAIGQGLLRCDLHWLSFNPRGENEFTCNVSSPDSE